MSNEPMVFQNPEFGKIQATEIDSEPYFIANEVAKCLGYVDCEQAIRKHCKYAKILKGVDSTPFTASHRGIRIIPEADVYALIFGSKLPKAEAFKDWVFTEVLPTIRKTGKYTIKQLTMEDLCREYLATCEKQRQLEADISKVSAEKQLAITQRDEIGNNFGAGPEYYKVSEIPWLYAIFKRGYEKYLHKRISQMLAGICKAQGTQPKKCQHDNGGHWWRAYPKQVIEMLHQQLLADPHLLQNLRISKRKSVPQNKCRCLNFR